MSQSIVQPFDFKGSQVRVLTDEQHEPWFVAKDVASVLGYANPNEAISDHVDDEDKLNSKTLSSLGQRGGWIINESGLYSLILSSKLPAAREFKRWVTSEVLPSIRKHGAYMTEQVIERTLTDPDYLIQLATTLKEERAKRIEAERTIKAQQPKVLFADAVAASDGTCLVGELAKMLTQAGFTIGQNRLFAKLRDDGFLGKSGSHRNVPLQQYVESGLFKIKETAITHADGHISLNRTPKVTGKGQAYFLKRYAHQDTDIAGMKGI